MKGTLIAPCGMNCSLCVSYQFKEKDLNRQGFHKTYCPGCIPRGTGCQHMGGQCSLLKNGFVRFCFECDKFPCTILKKLDKRYQTRYHMSMIENLEYIRDNTLNSFCIKDEIKWRCPRCGNMICCHNGLCLTCDLDKLKRNKKYRWDDGPAKL